jgi:hypothetical protein
VPISSTKTHRLASTCTATITLQAHLENSSRSSAPIVRFLREVQPRFIQRLTAESLRVVPVTRSKKRRLWPKVALGCSSTSFSRRSWAFSSALRGRPGLFLGVRGSPCRTVVAYRLGPRRGSPRTGGSPQPWTYLALKRRLYSCGDLRNRLSCIHDRIWVNLYAYRCKIKGRGSPEAGESRWSRRRGRGGRSPHQATLRRCAGFCPEAASRGGWPGP